MGFLDNVKKGLNDVASSVNQAVNNASSGSSDPAATAPVPPPPPPGGGGAAVDPELVDPDFIDATAPATWFAVPGDLELVIGEALGRSVTFGLPETFDSPDAVTARWSTTDGTITVDLASIKEATLLGYGAPQALVDAYRSSLPGSQVNAVCDIGVTGSSRPGHVRVLSCLGDMAARCDLYGPDDIPGPDLGAAAEAVVLVALKLDR